MNDVEIKQYLDERHWSVNPQDFIMDILNTSPQIIHKKYNPITGELTMNTPDNIFTFKWNLHKL